MAHFNEGNQWVLGNGIYVIGSPPLLESTMCVRNIQSGKRVGLHTVLVGTSDRTKGVDYALENIHNIKEALPELWEADEKSEKIRYFGKVAIETFVTA
ncbi:hypothetical protein HHK36_033449 [Tetracentron sinense]|uniref:Uncharacterized protein n=1 Tax=Tetracentron sinense TaxID=13715 RepID=A0A834Y5Y4_TETSI|nr:hypothetical protein HHK36_033449 [Tetracentron sinense]